MFEVSDDQQNDPYYEALYQEIDGDGPAAMLYDLQRMDLGDWHPRQIPKTDALRRQQEMSLGHLEEWLLTLLEDGCLPSPIIDKPWASNPTTLRNDAKDKVPRLRDLILQRARHLLETLGLR